MCPPERAALLDNFTWGNPRRPEMLGALVRACRGCHDAAVKFGAPFVSGKDSLNNEFAHDGDTISVPYTLLISAMGVVDDVTRTVTMDLKRAGSRIYLAGVTRAELGASHLHILFGGKVECSSCHDVHNSYGNDNLLYRDNSGSDLCLTCHIK